MINFNKDTVWHLHPIDTDEVRQDVTGLLIAGETDGMFEVKANKQYVLFSENHAEKGECCDEYVMTCDGNHENNMIYIIFSPNMFVKASDTQSGEKVKVGNEILSLPRQLPYKDFQRWLLLNRRLDKKMQVVVKGIEVSKE